AGEMDSKNEEVNCPHWLPYCPWASARKREPMTADVIVERSPEGGPGHHTPPGVLAARDRSHGSDNGRSGKESQGDAHRGHSPRLASTLPQFGEPMQTGSRVPNVHHSREITKEERMKR